MINKDEPLFASEGKSKDTLDKFRQHMIDQGASPKQIQEICCRKLIAMVYMTANKHRLPTIERRTAKG